MRVQAGGTALTDEWGTSLRLHGFDFRGGTVDDEESRVHYGFVRSGKLAQIRKRGFTRSEAQEYDDNDF